MAFKPLTPTVAIWVQL